jgi:hypothetical protein
MSGAWRGSHDPAAVRDCRQSWCVCRAATDCKGAGAVTGRGHYRFSYRLRRLVIAHSFRLLAGNALADPRRPGRSPHELQRRMLTDQARLPGPSVLRQEFVVDIGRVFRGFRRRS